jgi:hypothetical protein
MARRQSLNKKPLQIYLQPEQERALRNLAARYHVSLAELIRRSVDQYLAQSVPPEDDPSLELIGLGSSGRPDLAAAHDELVAHQALGTSDARES